MLIVDHMRLRRTQLVRFLREWSQEVGLEVAELDTGDIARLNQPINCRIQILNIGADPPDDPKIAAVFRVLKAVCPDAPIVVFGENASVENVRLALRLGAASYIPASLHADLALAALRFVLAGGTYYPLEPLRVITTDPPEPQRARPASTIGGRTETERSPPQNKPNGDPSRTDDGAPDPNGCSDAHDLTPRQEEVLKRLQRGLSNKEIARELEMSEATVKVHVRQLMKRLGVTNRTQAAVLAVRLRNPAREPKLRPSASIVPYTPMSNVSLGGW